MNNKVAFVICWFGKMPQYFPVWAKSCEYNKEFKYLIFTDDIEKRDLPDNIEIINFSLTRFRERAEKVLNTSVSIKKSYRICDFRPMFGRIFKDYLSEYDFWGHCDIDVVFGNIGKYVNDGVLENIDVLFNGGHFTLYRNIDKVNRMYMLKGSLFSYKKVIKNNVIYAFDETTGIQNIAKINNIKSQFGIPYIETESKYHQLRSRLDKINPDKQLYYWENGNLYRTKYDNGKNYYQELVYIHLQKRKLCSSINGNIKDVKSFWITPNGFVEKVQLGVPTLKDYDKYNKDDGQSIREKEEKIYKKNKIKDILKRTPYQVYVRIRQQFAGINQNDGAREEREWEIY